MNIKFFDNTVNLKLIAIAIMLYVKLFIIINNDT